MSLAQILATHVDRHSKDLKAHMRVTLARCEQMSRSFAKLDSAKATQSHLF